MANQLTEPSPLAVAVDDLIRLAAEEGLVGISVSHGGTKIAVTLGGEPSAEGYVEAEAEGVETPAEPDRIHVVRSKFVGVLHRHGAQSVDQFLAEVGERVSEGQVIACVESMRVMNEITADASGLLVEFLVQGGEIIEYDQPLAALRLDD